MLAYAPALLCLLMFCAGVVHERRRFSNAVLLGLTFLFAGSAWLFELHRTHPVLGRNLAIALLLVVALGIVTLAWFLISNGTVMVRKEGTRPANLLSLLAGVALVALLVLLVATLILRNRTLAAVTGTAVALTGYVAFLFLCFVVYAFLYGRLNPPRRADYVVVLGSGLAGGATVPRCHRCWPAGWNVPAPSTPGSHGAAGSRCSSPPAGRGLTRRSPSRTRWRTTSSNAASRPS